MTVPATAASATSTPVNAAASAKNPPLTTSTKKSGFHAFNEESMNNDENLQMKQEDFDEIRKLPGNMYCVDCGSSNPDWGSPNFGILFCFSCSGIHRGLGVHISFVRSVKMDSWKSREIQLMKNAGGNTKCNEFLQSHHIVTDASEQTGDQQRRSIIQQKYDCPAAELYKQKLIAQIDGLPEPTELPKRKVVLTPTQYGKRKMEGFGSSPMPEEESSSSDSNNGTQVVKTILYVAVPAVAAAALWMVLPH